MRIFSKWGQEIRSIDHEYILEIHSIMRIFSVQDGIFMVKTEGTSNNWLDTRTIMTKTDFIYIQPKSWTIVN
jgi:hypothetical protein